MPGPGPSPDDEHRVYLRTQKTSWDKLNIILTPVGGIVSALAIASLGYFGSGVLQQQQSLEANVRLYSELMSKREESESDLRSEMFSKIIESFLSREPEPLEAKMLNLEMLAQNFHESLDIGPLFRHLERQIETSLVEEDEKVRFRDRVNKVAREVTGKELLILESAGRSFRRSVDLATLAKKRGGLRLDPEKATLNGIERLFKLVVLQADPENRELRVRVEIRTTLEDGDSISSDSEFDVGFFDFPLVENIRLSHDQRFAVNMRSFSEYSAELTLVYFPGAYASLKEKPYYGEIIQQLRDSESLTSR